MATKNSTRSSTTNAPKGAINMTGDQLHTELVRISALVSGGLTLISGIADDDVVKAEALLNMADDNLLDLQHQCNLDWQAAEGGAA